MPSRCFLLIGRDFFHSDGRKLGIMWEKILKVVKIRALYVSNKNYTIFNIIRKVVFNHFATMLLSSLSQNGSSQLMINLQTLITLFYGKVGKNFLSISKVNKIKKKKFDWEIIMWQNVNFSTRTFEMKNFLLTNHFSSL